MSDLKRNGQANESTDGHPIGVIGLGLLGGAIAQRLLKIGHHVVGFDIDDKRRTLMAAEGVTATARAIDVVEVCDQIILSLPTTDVVAAVIDEVSPALRGGQYLLDTTTGEPDAIAALADRLASQRIHYLDATVGGSSSQAQSGDIIMLVGGQDSAFAACRPLLVQLARRVYHAGPPGAGAKLKLVHNLILGLNRAVLAEGLTFARSLGLNPESVLEVLRSSAAYSRVMDQKGKRMVSNNFDPEARLSQHLKDVRLMLEAGAAAGARLPLCETHRELLEATEAAGWGTLDNSAIIRAFDNGTHESDRATA